MDGIGGRRFYAAKSLVNDEGRRFYFAWAHDRAQQSNFGEWYWGGQFCIPHEVCQNESGELDVKLPREYVEAWLEPVEWSYEHKLGKFRTYGDKCIYLDSVSTLSYGFIKVKEKSFLFSCKVKPVDMADHFGLLLIIPITRAPNMVPDTAPTPPVIDIPPRTQAAMASSS